MPNFRTFLFTSLLVLAAAVGARSDPPAAGVVGKPADPPTDANPLACFPPPRVFPEPTKAEGLIAAALAKPVEANWNDTQLGDVVHELAEKYGIPIQMDMAALTADGKGSETLINKTVRGVSLKSLLQLMLDERGLTAVVRNEVLLITSRSAAETLAVTRTYQVHDLVIGANDPTAARPEFGALVDLIRSTIQPESWREAGGTQGEIKEYVGAGIIGLVITQTNDAHEEIASLLASLRAARLPEIARMQAKNPPVPRLGEAAARSHGPAGYSSGAPQAASSAEVEAGVAKPPEMSAGYRALVEGNTQFACRLYRQLAKEPSENIVFSPHGAAGALETLWLGARRKTAEELGAALAISADPFTRKRLGDLRAWLEGNKAVRGYQLAGSTYLLLSPDEPILASFVAVAGTYGARVEPIDFSRGRGAALVPLLEAVQAETGDRVVPQGLTDDIDENTRLFVLNTAGFQGRWGRPFAPERTLREIFHAPGGDVKGAMMHSVETLGYREIDGLTIVRKEYDGLTGVNRGALYILLPAIGDDTLANCEKQLTAENLSRWFQDMQEQPVELHLPKFTIESVHDFRSGLEQLGIRAAFAEGDGATAAAFSGINGSSTLRLQNIRQRAKIAVDEGETPGAGETAPSVAGPFGFSGQQPESRALVRCDRPFLFLIRDEHTGIILYMGRVTEPDNDPQAEVFTPPKS